MKRKNAEKLPLFSFRYLLYDFTKLTAALPGLIWLRPKWIYENKAAKKRLRGGYLVIANHAGFLDPVYVMAAIWYRRHRFICIKDFFESKAGWLFRGFRCIPVDRENFGIDTLRQISGALKAGSIVSLFPEGHVNDGSGQMAAFKSGMVLMALQGNAPIVPVYAMPPAHWYNRLRLVIGEPIDIIASCGVRPSFSQIDAIAGMLQEKEEELKQRAEATQRRT